MSGLRYLFRSGQGATRRVMHVQRHSVTGEPLFEPICMEGGPYNRSINAPFQLGRPVCKKCLRRLRHDA